MIRRRHRHSGQLGSDLLHQRTKLRLHTGVLVQQVGEPARPPLRRSLPGLLQSGARRGQLLAGLRQPPLRDLSLAGITAAQQPGEPAPRTASHASVIAAAATVCPANCANASNASPGIRNPLPHVRSLSHTPAVHRRRIKGTDALD